MIDTLFGGEYCEGCFDEYCCTSCGVDLDGERRCWECWEPPYIKPGERY